MSRLEGWKVALRGLLRVRKWNMEVMHEYLIVWMATCIGVLGMWRAVDVWREDVWCEDLFWMDMGKGVLV